jgi:hypothetical protein
LNIPLGARLAEGAEVTIYEHRLIASLVVKIPRQRPDIDRVLAERLAGERMLHQAHLSAYVLDTHVFVPGTADGREYPFVETQTRVRTTLFDDVCAALERGQTEQALQTVARFFDFEHGVLWAWGVVLRDAGSFLKNVALHQGRIQILDFSSFSRDRRALEGLVVRARAERRINLMLDMLRLRLSGALDGVAWDPFCARLWKLAGTHYQLDRMKRAWLALPQHREDECDRYDRWTTQEDQACE